MLNQTVLSHLKNTVRKYLSDSDYKVFVFGSQALGNNRKYSDIDLGIQGVKPVKSSDFVNIQADLEASDIPFRVDLVDFTQVTEKFRQTALSSAVFI